MAQFGPPTTIPRLRPVPEHRAEPDLAALYHDAKAVLGVPWVGVVVQALAHYRPFFDRAYEHLRPSLLSHYTERIAAQLRLQAWQAIGERFSIADHASTLRARWGYSAAELAEIRRSLDVFDYGNPKYFLLATIVHEALTSTEPIGTARPDPVDLLPRSPVQATGVATMLEEHHVDEDLRALYEDIKTTLELPFVNSDYKAMARWPTYLTLAWHSLKSAVDTEPYRQARQTLHHACVHAAHHIPHAIHYTAATWTARIFRSRSSTSWSRSRTCSSGYCPD